MVTKYGREFTTTEHGGLIEVGATLPEGSTARIYDGAVVFKKAAENMHGGTFRGGTFRGGVFWGGTFRGGVFRGGVFWGGVFTKSPSCAQRSDGYMFVAKRVGDDLRIWAGCRNFSWDEAVTHWGNPDHHMHEESMRIINFLKAQEEAQ